MSDTMTEGVVVRWTVKVGDTVKSGDILAEVETDKATMDMEVYAKGTVLAFLVEEGNAVPIDAPIAVVGTPGEDYAALLAAKGTSATPAATPVTNTEVAAAPVASPASTAAVS